MPTRADFWVGEGEDAEWLGSIPWDGYPDGIEQRIIAASTESEYRTEVTLFLTSSNDTTMPDQGWPWPWSDSRTTDYAYLWLDGRVWASHFGDAMFLVQPELDDHGEPDQDDPHPKVVVRGRPSYPAVIAPRNVRFPEGSGFITLSIPGPRTKTEE